MALSESEALQLFEDRARQVRPDFSLTPENTPTVLQIITKIDGESIPSWEEAAKFTALALTNRFSVTFQRQTDSGVEDFTQTLIAKPISEKLTIKRLKLPPKFRPIAGKVMDNGAAAEAGLKAHAFWPLFPAAATTEMPTS